MFHSLITGRRWKCVSYKQTLTIYTTPALEQFAPYKSLKFILSLFWNPWICVEEVYYKINLLKDYKILVAFQKVDLTILSKSSPIWPCCKQNYALNWFPRVLPHMAVSQRFSTYTIHMDFICGRETRLQFSWQKPYPFLEKLKYIGP